MVETDFEPLVHLLMDLVVFGTEFLRRHLLLQGLRLRCSAVLICSTDIESLSSASFVISGQILGEPQVANQRAAYKTHLAKTSALRTEPTMLPK